ncbi:MAG: site-specific integrase [Proteobacteria bacterium]|uniref:site-specific integrase n=1 Tax=Zoogloea sp. LCSB751 TaxID=1965277 RepID=UPI0009A48241|nr:site-specific integrase [Zoogloea sp. LCSB751]MBS0353926.1 site-specific integrase [Pseudomonadota bacterium]
MGSIRRRTDNNLLFLDFRFRDIRCREQTALPDTPANRKKVQKVLDRIEADIAAGIFDYRKYFPASKNAARFDAPPAISVAVTVTAPSAPPVAPTPLFKAFAETWYLEKEVEWRKSHRITIRRELDSLISRFGEKAVGQIAKADVLAYRAELGKVTARGKETKLSAARINKMLNPLRQILNEAADRFNFPTPYQNIKQLRIKRTDVDPFSLEEVKSILATVRPDFHDYFTVRFFTGMRTGEVDGLKWKYVDFERRLILVRETVVLGDEEYTKTDGSQRDIQMSQLVFDALKRQEEATRKISEFVFCNRLNKPLDHKNVTNRVWYPLLRHLGLKKRRPYQCRHTAATLWLAAGEAPEWIARQLGHTTTEMLFRVYSRYVPNLTRRDGSAFERLITQSIADQPLPVQHTKESSNV